MKVEGIRFSAHAELRAKEFKLPKWKVIELLQKATSTYPSNGQVACKCGEFVVILDSTVKVVITVLPNKAERWEHDPKFQKKATQ